MKQAERRDDRELRRSQLHRWEDEGGFVGESTAGDT